VSKPTLRTLIFPQLYLALLFPTIEPTFEDLYLVIPLFFCLKKNTLCIKSLQRYIKSLQSRLLGISSSPKCILALLFHTTEPTFEDLYLVIPLFFCLKKKTSCIKLLQRCIKSLQSRLLGISFSPKCILALLFPTTEPTFEDLYLVIRHIFFLCIQSLQSRLLGISFSPLQSQLLRIST